MSIIKRLSVVWGSPESLDDAAFVEEINRVTDGVSPAILERAANYLISNYRGSKFPTPAQIVNAIRESAPPISPPEGPKYPEWSHEALATADRLIQSEIGRTAAREGWILSLHDYCRKHRCLPDNRDIRQLKAAAEGFNSAYSECCRGNGGTLGKSLRRFGDVFLAKREKYARMALGEDA